MGVFKLGKMTFGSLFKKPETVLYPIEKKPQPAGLKGHIALEAEQCILCGMCDRSCATNCISVDKANHTWAIDRFQCVQCGYCITVCPKKCLSMDPNYAPASTAHTIDTVTVPVQEKPAKNAAAAKEDKPAATETVAPAASVEPGKADQASEGVATAPVRDAVLEQKLALLDEEKAAKVRKALEAAS